MTVYVVTGKLGAGKTLAAVGKIIEYLSQGRRVATNLDIRVENFKNPFNRNISITRVPDKPLSLDLDALGRGHDLDYPNEEKNGLLALDEAGTWLNSRSWNDKTRRAVIDWFLHARKLRWDIILIVQDISILDKQVRECLAEYTVFARRLDRLRIPLIGWLTSLSGFEIKPPRIHVGIVKYGDNSQSPTVDKWWYRGRDLYPLYDTEQIYSESQDGNFTYLTPWHLKGRYMHQPTLMDHLNTYLLPFIKLVLLPFYLIAIFYLWIRSAFMRQVIAFALILIVTLPLIADPIKGQWKDPVYIVINRGTELMHSITAQKLKFAKSEPGNSPEFNNSNYLDARKPPKTKPPSD